MWKKWMVLVLFSVAVCAAENSLVPVRNSVPEAEILIPADAPQAEAFAADELSFWIGEITGGKIPVVETASPGGKIRFFIGRKAAEKKFPRELAKLKNTDGFAIRFDGNDVYLFGARPRGTFYAVCRLLEENSDLIWARPDPEFGTVFTKTPDFRIKPDNLLEIPVFPFRGWNVCSLRGHRPTGMWIMRNGGNYADQIPLPETDMLTCFGGGHGLFRIIPPETYFKTNPEFFPFFANTGTRRGESVLCFTNPKLPEAFAENLSRIIQEMPVKPEVLWIGLNDTWTVCDCAECHKPIPLEDGSVLKMTDPRSTKDPKFRSTQYFQFLNRVMKHFAPRHPDIAFRTFAYIYTAEPPAVALDPNLGILYAPYPTRNDRLPLLHEQQDKEWRERFKTYTEKTRNLGFYEYYGPSARLTSLTAKEDLRELKRRGGTIGVLSECGPDYPLPGEGAPLPLSKQWDMLPLEYYLITRLMWNPDQDYEALRNRYLQRAFRESAPEMKQFYDLYRDQWLQPANQKLFTNCHTGDTHLFREIVVNGGIEQQCRDLLSLAQKKAVHPNSKKLIEAVRKQFDENSAGLNRLQVARLADGKNTAWDSPVWQSVRAESDFLRTRPYLRPDRIPEGSVQLQLAQDAETLFLRVQCGKGGAVREKPDSKERIPDGDRVEINFGPCRFIVGADGSFYDEKFGNFQWKSGHKLDFRKLPDGYGFVLSIPLSAIDGKGNRTLQFNAERFYENEKGDRDHASLGGQITGRHYYTLALEQKGVTAK